MSRNDRDGTLPPLLRQDMCGMELLVLDLSWLPLIRETSAGPMFVKYGDHHFELPLNIDGVLLIGAAFNTGCVISRGAIFPDQAHSIYAQSAINLLNHLSPPYPST